MMVLMMVPERTVLDVLCLLKKDVDTKIYCSTNCTGFLKENEYLFLIVNRSSVKFVEFPWVS